MSADLKSLLIFLPYNNVTTKMVAIYLIFYKEGYMKKILFVLLAITSASSFAKGWAVNIVNNTDQNVAISVLDNSCMHYPGDHALFSMNKHSSHGFWVWDNSGVSGGCNNDTEHWLNFVAHEEHVDKSTGITKSIGFAVFGTKITYDSSPGYLDPSSKISANAHPTLEMDRDLKLDVTKEDVGTVIDGKFVQLVEFTIDYNK
jgi:hypothetical protein